MRLRVLGPAGLLVLLAGCGAGPAASAAPGPSSPPAPAPAAASSASPPAPRAAAAPTALPSGGELGTSCADGLTDGGAHELAGVELVRAGPELVAAFVLGALPVDDAPTYLTVTVGSADGGVVHQLGVELAGDRPVAAYLGASPDAPLQRLEDAVHVDGSSVHASFPASVLDDLGPGWRWYAGSGGGEGVTDTCPDVAADGTITAVTVP